MSIFAPTRSITDPFPYPHVTREWPERFDPEGLGEDLMRLRIRAVLVVLLALMGLHLLKPQSNQVPELDFESLDHYAQLSLVAYSTHEEIQKSLGEEAKVCDFPTSQLRALTLLSKEVSWVGVRGTSNLRNALYDIDLKKKRSSRLGVDLHDGFEAASDEMYPWLTATLPKNVPVRLTGHSLGGAVAAILAGYLRLDGYQVERVVTFGQPKVTNKAGVAALRGLPLLRVVHGSDPVPTVPPTGLVTALTGGIFRHFGPELVLNHDGSLTYFDEHNAERLLSSSFWENLSHVHPDDHRMVGYIKALKDARPRTPAGTDASDTPTTPG
jgi:hypothetical protein